ncbi:Plasmodium vivax Vir protein, putative [Plasmodium vivax]|uniref:Vir protein, putative n=1 Tax=Plasmodium vivax TaxID=5855 RepID=A0A1G4E451_PLAVI|nr:Plasmodium vivax Vir protein, putative [Plasmodium vivax]
MLPSGLYKELERSDLSFKNELNSENFYETLNTLSDISGYLNDCSLLDELPFGKKIKTTCARVLKYIEIIHKDMYKKDDPYDVCLLLSFWVYSRFYDILQNQNKVYQAYAKLQTIWNYFIENKLKESEIQTCRPLFNIVLHDDWRYRKELYEYYVDYYPVSETVKNYPVRCNEFYKYVESKKKLYEYFKELCTPKDRNRCPEFYDKCEKYDPHIVLPYPYCHNNILHERAAALPRLPRIGSGHSVNESDSEEESDDMKKTFDAPILSGNPHNVRMYGNVLLGVVATSMASGALYRFTPLGSMIRNGLGWNNNNMRNFNGGDIGLYDYASESFNPYPGEEHYIGYHPA